VFDYHGKYIVDRSLFMSVNIFQHFFFARCSGYVVSADSYLRCSRLKFRLGAGYFDIFLLFPQLLQAYVGIIFQISPQLLPSLPFPVYYLVNGPLIHCYLT
jgi:hypothetical protein